MKERRGRGEGRGGKGVDGRAIARARYKLHLNRSRGTRGIRNLNGHRGGGGRGEDLANPVDGEEKQESETKSEVEEKR